MISRRDFSRLLALSSSVLLPQQLPAWPAQLVHTAEVDRAVAAISKYRKQGV